MIQFKIMRNEIKKFNPFILDFTELSTFKKEIFDSKKLKYNQKSYKITFQYETNYSDTYCDLSIEKHFIGIIEKYNIIFSYYTLFNNKPNHYLLIKGLDKTLLEIVDLFELYCRIYNNLAF